jgi:opacity protein-like surface antigen
MNSGQSVRARRSSRFASCLVAFALLVVAVPAAAQDGAPAPAATPAAPLATAPAVAPDVAPKVPSFSIALERVGGIGYAKAAAKEGDSSVSLVALGVGGVTPNPFAVPRLGLDFILPSNLTLGGAIGFTRLSASTSSGSKSQDVGSVFLYTLTPRLGYRIALSEKVDLTPRAGLTFAGASASPSDSKNDASIFAIAIGADAPVAFRMTDSFNLLVGVGIDYTVSATVSSTSTSTTVTGTGTGGSTTSTSTKTDDLKGSLFSMQAWLGIGGYL